MVDHHPYPYIRHIRRIDLIYWLFIQSPRSESLAKKLMTITADFEMIKCSNCIFIKVFLTKNLFLGLFK